jgi:hypothetical protein
LLEQLCLRNASWSQSKVASFTSPCICCFIYQYHLDKYAQQSSIDLHYSSTSRIVRLWSSNSLYNRGTVMPPTLYHTCVVLHSIALPSFNSLSSSGFESESSITFNSRIQFIST